MRQAVSLLAALLLLLLPSLAVAGSFGVSPIRVDLDRGNRSAVVQITNEDERKLSFQVKLVEWTQDANGQDQYAESQDLIFFPPLFSLNPNEKRLLRIGTKTGATPGVAERSYRLYIEELPPPAEAGVGAQLRIALRFALPIFVAPASPSRKLVVESVRAQAGSVTLRLRNEGSQSTRLETVRVRQAGQAVSEAQGWYVLAGKARDFEVKVDPGKCPLTGPLEVEAQAEGVVLVRDTLADAAALCKRP